MPSSLVPFRQTGQVTAMAIEFALIAAVLVLPSMLILRGRWHTRRGRLSVGGAARAAAEPEPESEPEPGPEPVD